MISSLPVFCARQAVEASELETARAAVDLLSRPAPRKWIVGRVLALLSHYYVAKSDEALAAAVADDWCAALDGQPAWAISNACRWWMSANNERRHFKPMTGDIQSRVGVEMARVKTAAVMIRQGIAAKPSERAVPVEDTTDRAAAAQRIMAQVFGGVRA